MGPRVMSDGNRTGTKVVLAVTPVVCVLAAIDGMWLVALICLMTAAMAGANLHRDAVARREPRL